MYREGEWRQALYECGGYFAPLRNMITGLSDRDSQGTMGVPVFLFMLFMEITRGDILIEVENMFLDKKLNIERGVLLIV